MGRIKKTVLDSRRNGSKSNGIGAKTYVSKSRLCPISSSSSRILRSKFQSTGQRLFANKSILKGETIATFSGVVKTKEEHCRDIQSNPLYDQYAHHLRNGIVLSCYESYKVGKCKASAANTPRGCLKEVESNGESFFFVKACENSELVKGKIGKRWRIKLVAKKDLCKGTEVLVAYGNKFRILRP